MAEFDDVPVNADTWLEFLGPPGSEAYCGLCGNRGVVDTRGRVIAPDGNDCGIRAFCFCPNGRTLKHKLDSVLPAEKSLDWHTLHRALCEDPTCTGCKRCKYCDALTRSYGFEDHICFNCRNPPSD